MKKEEITEFKALLRYYMIRENYSYDELAIALHMATSTLYAKVRNPDEFTIGQIKKLAEVLKFRSDDYLKIVGTHAIMSRPKSVFHL